MGRNRAGRAEAVLRWTVYGLAAVLFGMTLVVVVARFVQGTEGEWMTGAVRDAIERVRDGKPLYGPPSAEFVPFLYPPLFYWFAAALAHFTSSFVAGKLVSIVATSLCAFAIHRIAKTMGATRVWARLAVVLFVSTYSLTTHFYDLERVDATGAAFVLVGLSVLLTRDSDTTAGIGGAILALAFFAKQPGIFIFIAVVGALVLAREMRRAAITAGAGVLVWLAMFAYLRSTTGPWFSYYCIELPRHHGVKPELLTQFFIVDAPKAFAYSAASIAVGVPALIASITRRGERPAWRDVVFGAAVIAGMAGGFFLRAHFGGWPNVLIAWLPLGSAAIGVIGSRVERWADEAGLRQVVMPMLLGGIALQLLGAMFDPNELAPRGEDVRDRERLVALVRQLEKEGDVWLSTTGAITRKPSVHAAALYDLVRAGDHAPADLLEALAERRYAALLLGVPDEYSCRPVTCYELQVLILRNYFVAGHRRERDRTGMSGFDARARWILRPRKRPLSEVTTHAMLFRRMRLEMALADLESWKMNHEREIDAADDIEARADAELAASEP
jgi:hypothetical protein